HDVKVDADEGQRLAVEGAEQAGCRPGSSETDDLRLDTFGSQALLAQDDARRLVGGGHGEQEMFATDVAVPEPAGVLLGLDDHGAGAIGEALEHHRLPIRRPYFRCTVCLLTPSRLAMSCQDHPSFRAFSIWRNSSRSVRARRAATARSPVSGSLLAAPSASSSVVCMGVSLC